MHPETQRFLTPSLFTTLSPGTPPPTETDPEYKDGLGGGAPPVASAVLPTDIKTTKTKEAKSNKLTLRIKTHYSYIKKEGPPLQVSERRAHHIGIRAIAALRY
tara:strand:- start:544 stop:852 length:309 start_codon:yes stop_codon:yes gene_type:complete